MTKEKYSGNAIASFVIGLCGILFVGIFFWIGIITTILALTFGEISLKQMKKDKKLKGKSLAYWGIGLGCAYIVLIIVGIIWGAIIKPL